MRPNSKFVVTESSLQQDAFWGRAADANRHQCLCRFSPVYLAIALLACWMLHWPVSFSPFLSRFFPQIIGPLHNRKTYPASEIPLCSQMRIYGEYQSTSDKWETENRKVKVLEAVEGWGRCWGKTAAVQTGYSQWGLLGFSPLKVLQSLNLSHIQSLGWCIHGKTWKSKKGTKVMWADGTQVASDFPQMGQQMGVWPHLEGLGLHGPSSVSFSSSLRWRSQSAAAGHSYGSTGRAMKILFHPRQNPWQERHVDLKAVLSSFGH